MVRPTCPTAPPAGWIPKADGDHAGRRLDDHQTEL
jgi:hypothetical protein